MERAHPTNALGDLGGLSWAVLVAWACTRAPREATGTDVGLLAYFFETFASWPWPRPVTITPETARYPLGNQRELIEGSVVAWDALFEPADLARELPIRLVVSVEAPSPEARETAAGWVLGHLTALVYRMESDRGLFARPFPNARPEGPFVIGLSSRGSEGSEVLSARPGRALAWTVEDFHASFLEWSHRPAGASLSVELVPR